MAKSLRKFLPLWFICIKDVEVRIYYVVVAYLWIIASTLVRRLRLICEVFLSACQYTF